MATGIKLKESEIAAAYDSDELRKLYPPILDVPQVTSLLQLKSPKTIYHWIQMGRLEGTFRKRGKHLLFWRNRVIEKVFNGSDWKETNHEKSKNEEPGK